MTVVLVPAATVPAVVVEVVILVVVIMVLPYRWMELPGRWMYQLSTLPCSERLAVTIAEHSWLPQRAPAQELQLP